MSNLGGYQKIVVAAKKVGGVRNFMALTISGSLFAYKSCEILLKKVVNCIKNPKNKGEKPVYKTFISGKSNEGLMFNIGDEFRILESDGDAVLIEKIGDSNNPYIVDKKLLISISDYK